jgi:hypothetical protein
MGITSSGENDVLDGSKLVDQTEALSRRSHRVVNPQVAIFQAHHGHPHARADVEEALRQCHGNHEASGTSRPTGGEEQGIDHPDI